VFLILLIHGAFMKLLMVLKRNINKSSVEGKSAVPSENQRKHINALCVENLGSLHIKPCGT
jgi:hypothetical protein